MKSILDKNNIGFTATVFLCYLNSVAHKKVESIKIQFVVFTKYVPNNHNA